MLTDRAVKQAKVQEKAYKLPDEKGLFLLVHPNGSKYWRLKYRIFGKEKLFAIGVYPQVGVSDAREKRDLARKLIADGIDPVSNKRQAKLLAQLKSANSFESVAREWHSKRRETWSADHARRILQSLETDVFPHIGDRPIVELTAPEVLAVLRRIESRDALDHLGRVRQRVAQVFKYAIQSGKAVHNPAAEMTGACKTRKQEHRPALSRQDLPEFLAKLAEYDGNAQTRLALKLLILTFVRTTELRGARWEEFDFERAEWRIPAERMKMKEAHLVPLSTQALEVLEELKPITGSGVLVFPSQSGDDKTMSENTMLYAMYRMGYHSRATVHGFRATASTVLNEMGYRPDAIERQLAHAERNKVRSAYNRSEYLAERRDMMRGWGDFIAAQGGNNVIPLRGGK